MAMGSKRDDIVNDTRKLWKGSETELQAALSRVPQRITAELLQSELASSNEERVLARNAKYLLNDGFTDCGLAEYGHMLMDHDEHLGDYLEAVIRRAAQNPQIWEMIRPKSKTRLYMYVQVMRQVYSRGMHILPGVMFNYIAAASKNPELDPHMLQNWPRELSELLQRLDVKKKESVP